MKKQKGYMIVYRYKEVSNNNNVIGYIDEILGFTDSEEVALKVARNFIRRQMTEIKNTVSDNQILGYAADGRTNTNVNDDDCIPFAVMQMKRKRLEHIVEVALKVARNFIKRQMVEIRNTQVKNCVKIKRIRVSDDRILGYSADGRSNTNVNEDDCIPFAVVLTTGKRLEHIVSVCDSTKYK